MYRGRVNPNRATIRLIAHTALCALPTLYWVRTVIHEISVKGLRGLDSGLIAASIGVLLVLGTLGSIAWFGISNRADDRERIEVIALSGTRLVVTVKEKGGRMLRHLEFPFDTITDIRTASDPDGHIAIYTTDGAVWRAGIDLLDAREVVHKLRDAICITREVRET